ncbi:MAG: ATP-binding protein [Mariniphaga sp.]|nr:ATP-binding protein [Mariniphaga sp.]
MKELSLHILDIMENSVSGGATRIEVNIYVNEVDNLLIIQVTDNGRGMDSETMTHVTDPFFTTRSTRKIGMGISLFKQQAEQTGGAFNIKSEPGKGSEVEASFGLNNIDRQPLGDVAGVIVNIAASYSDIDFVLNIDTTEGNFQFSSHEVSKILEGLPLNKPEVMLWLKELIQTNMTDLKMTN